MPISQPTQPATHPIHAGQAFAIISGENPRFAPEIRGGHKGLEQALAQSGVKYEATDGNYGNGKAHSPVILAYGLPRDQAMELGRKMGQESIIFSNAGQHEFLYTNGPNAGKFHPAGAQPMQVFPTMPDEGLTTRVPSLGHVRFNFDHGKLLDVPRKGSAMSEPANKSEVSVTELKKKLAEMLRGKIEILSKSMEGYASREVATNSDASVGDFRKSHTVLTVESSEAMWMEELSKSDLDTEPVEGCLICGQPGACACLLQDLHKAEKLSKSHTLAISSAMKRVYDSYLHNVGRSQFPNDPQKAHEVALAAAKDWASRAKDPKAIYQMAMGHSGEGQEQTDAVAHARPVEAPDSMGPPASPIVKADKCPTCGNELCKGCTNKNQGEGFSHTSQTQRKKGIAAEGRQVDKLGPEAKAKWDAGNQELSRRKRGQDPKTGKPLSQSEWKAELDKSDEWMSKGGPVEIDKCPSCGAHAPGWGMPCSSCANKPASNDKKAPAKKPAKKSEDFIDPKNANKPPTSTDDAKAGGPRIKNVGAENNAVAPATKPVMDKLAEGSGGDIEKGKGLKKDFAWGKDATSQGAQVKGGGSLNVMGGSVTSGGGTKQTPGKFTPNPAPAAAPKAPGHGGFAQASANVPPATKPATPAPAGGSKMVAGKGIGMFGTPGKSEAGLTKEAVPMTGGPDSPPIAPLASSQPGLGRPPPPPMAKPPNKGKMTSQPVGTKPLAPKKKGIPMGKAAIPMGGRTAAGAADAAAFAAKQGQVGAKQGGTAAPVAPKATPKPTTDYSDFMPPGKFGPAAGPPPAPGPKLPAPGTLPKP